MFLSNSSESGNEPPDLARDLSRRSATILMHRRVNNLNSGSGVHLLNLCDCLAESNYDIRIALAPVTSFGQIPYCRPDTALQNRGILVNCSGTIRLGSTLISLRKEVWLKAFRRITYSIREKTSRIFGGARTSFPSVLGTCLNPAEEEDVIRAVNEYHNDLVIAEYSSLAPLLEHCKTERRAVLLHDLFSSRSLSFQEAGLKPDHLNMSLKEECARLDNAEFCIHSSSVEKEVLEKELPHLRHAWMRPNIRQNRGVQKDEPRVVFVGADHGGNRDALDLILNEIWPAVRPHVPHELWIVGRVSDWVVGKHDQVRCVKFLDDLRTLGSDNTIGIAPMRAASGISIKIGTYLELGFRVLTFRKTVEAYGDVLDGLIVTADTPEEFAATLVKMLLRPDTQKGCSEEDFNAIQSRMTNKGLLDYLNERDQP
jgi:hypothetical protein